MATAKTLLKDALEENGETPADLEFVMYCLRGCYLSAAPSPTVTDFNGLPERQFDASYGGVEGEDVIAFSSRFIYVKGQYDGSEWMEAVPRTPEVAVELACLPCIGG